MNDKILQRWKDFVWGEHHKRNTRAVYYFPVQQWLTYYKKPYYEITQQDVNRYIQYCYDTRKPNTNAVNFWVFRKFIKWTGRKDLNIPSVTPVDAGKQALNEVQTQKLLDTVETLPPIYRLIFYLEYDTIRRPEEIRKLKLSDRYENLLKYDGKTGIKQCVMTERLIEAWDDYLKIRPFPATEEDNEYLILHDRGTYKGERLQSKWLISKTIKEIAMYSKIELPNGEKPTNYLIKRTSITRQLKECPDPKIIQLQAGHTNLRPTMKYNRVEVNDIKIYLNNFEHKNTPESLSKKRHSRKNIL